MTNQKTRWPLILVGAVVILCLALFVFLKCTGSYSSSSSDSPEQSPSGTTSTTYPYTTEDGSLTIQSLFLSSVFNSDGDGELAEDVASISYENTSGQFIRSAHLQITLESGDELLFQLTDIPADSKGIAFETSSRSCNDKESITKLSVNVEYETQDTLSNSITCDVSGIEITAKNTSGSDLSQVRIMCHCTLDGTLFGGEIFEYTIDSLPAGESTVITASDCIYGDALVVRTTANQ